MLTDAHMPRPNQVKQCISVATGEVAVANAGEELVSYAIGSCIVVTLYNAATCSGAIAHIMLPGTAPDNTTKVATRYAQNAIEAILAMMQWPTVNADALAVCLVGGGNVLKRENETICSHNIQSVRSIIKAFNMHIEAESLGGTVRRSVRFDVSSGALYVREDGAPEYLLWSSKGDFCG